jgi:hypothetical protein
MIFINEWLPNPTGPDTDGEWLELFNAGAAAVNLSGWRIENGSGKGVKLGDLQIGPRGYLVLYRKDTKLTLRNRDETLSLYNAQGELQDRAEFLGGAPEGKSVSRIGNDFLVTEATPGAANAFQRVEVAANPNPLGVPLNRQLASADVLALSLGVGVLITAAVFFGIKQYDYLSQLLFGRNEAFSQASRLGNSSLLKGEEEGRF